MNDIKIDTGAMNQIVSKAILEGIDDNQKQTILDQAVQALIAPRKDRYGQSTGLTPIQEAFDLAVNQTIGQVARELVSENEELLTRVRGLVADAMAAALKEPYTKLRENVNRAVAESIVDSY